MAMVDIAPQFWHPMGQFEASIGISWPDVNAAGESDATIGGIWWKGAAKGDTKTLSAAGGGAIFIPISQGQMASVGTIVRAGLQGVSGGVEDGTFDVYGDKTATGGLTLGQYLRVPMSSGSVSVSALTTDYALVWEMIVQGSLDNPILLVPLDNYIADMQIARPYGTYDTGSGLTKSGPFTFAIEFDDDTLGYFLGAPPNISWKQPTALSISTSSSPDEYGNVFTPPYSMRLMGLWAEVGLVAVSDEFLIALYSDPYGSDPTLLGLVTPDLSKVGGAGTVWSYWFNTSPWAVGTPVDLEVGQPYCIAVGPNTTNAVSINYTELGSGNQVLKQIGDFPDCQLVTRNGRTGAFANGSTSQIVRVGAIVSGLGNGFEGVHDYRRRRV